MPEPTTPSEIGATLREARERQGLTIAECAERTRIRAKYIQALEEERYSAMPEQAYARGFLRTYAIVLGLEPEELVAEFNRRSEPAGLGGDPTVLELRSREPQTGRLPEQRRRPPSRRRPRIGWLLLGAAVAVLVVVMVERGYGADAGPADPPTPVSGGYFSR